VPGAFTALALRLVTGPLLGNLLRHDKTGQIYLVCPPSARLTEHSIDLLPYQRVTDFLIPQLDTNIGHCASMLRGSYHLCLRFNMDGDGNGDP
jgi:hypothetical protein